MASPKEGATKTQNGQKYVYKNGQWRFARFRTPANDLIEGTGNTARNTTQRTAAATSTAASRTAEREKQAQQQAIGLRGRNQKPAAKPATKPAAKPTTKPELSSQGIRDYAGRGANTRTKPTGSKEYNDARNRQRETERERLKGVGNSPAKPSPEASTSSSSTPAPKPKPTATKPAGKVPASAPKADAGMKNQDKNYKGSYVSKFKEETARMSAASMSRQQGRSNLTSEDLKPKPAKNYSTPEDKSRYVSESGAPYKGPGYSAGKAEPAKPASPASPSKPSKTTKGMTLAERMRRRRMGLD